ncbi:rRNA methyltransferase 3, mitochondrial [Procambarus clarkii]|uniref:rRNA methyltransferase 3, mitochondrial n=1 Tax=Procambarus clarkii TaxID=6728 RepID=UPI001E675F17|nr:rRNA methyltransferase 3, mitochondrial-like [Procambarus clarkii]
MFTFRVQLCALVKDSIQASRNYRKLVRQPVRVHTPTVNEEEKVLKQYEETISVISSNTKTKESRPKKELNSHEVYSESSKKSWNIVNEIQYTHLAKAKNYIRGILNNVNSQKFRAENKIFVAEGHRIAKEALDAGVTPEAIYFSRLSDLAHLKSGPSDFGLKELEELNKLPLFKTPYKTLQMWSSLSTCPGILGVFKQPECKQIHHTSQNLPLTVILDEIREPGNIGGILRTVASVGVDHVILTKGCCDPWESKVLRAACGAHFRLKLTCKVTWDIMKSYIPDSTPLLLADVCRDQKDLNTISESENVQQQQDLAVEPSTKKQESVVYDDEMVSSYEMDSDGSKFIIDSSYVDEEHLSNYKNVKLPVHYYDEPEITRMINGMRLGACIIIGGETGLSNAAKKFSYCNGGIQIAVPVANGMDSLNTSVAAGIILYEIQKQYRQHYLHRQNIATNERSS